MTRQTGPDGPQAAGMAVDDGGRPVTDDGGRPVFVDAAGELVLDDAGTPPIGTPTATGTASPPVPESTPYVEDDQRTDGGT